MPQIRLRGSLAEGQNNPVPRNKGTFIATPRQWCMIDIDSLAWDGDVFDQQEMVSYAIQQLPAEFQSAGNVRQNELETGRAVLYPRRYCQIKLG